MAKLEGDWHQLKLQINAAQKSKAFGPAASVHAIVLRADEMKEFLKGRRARIASCCKGEIRTRFSVAALHLH